MNLNNIIRIEPVNPIFQVTWRLDLRCNFDCMYCPPQWHSLTSETKTLEQLQTAWRKIYQQINPNLKHIQINFTGGEVSINKDFLPFVTWLKTEYNNITDIVISSNGSASQDYYKQLLPHINSLTLSTHSEFFNESKFFNNVLYCAKQMIGTNKNLQISIMNEPWNQHRIETYKSFLTKLKIPHHVKEINWIHNTRPSHIENKNKKLFNFEKYV